MAQKITPNLWFDKEAEEAAAFYCEVFKNSRIIGVSRYGEAGPGAPGSVMTVNFELDGVEFVALNGGPEFKFNESVSFVVHCETQEEVDYYWERLSAVPEAEQCGWLKDKYGLSWQIVPSRMHEMLASGTEEQVARVTQAFLPMKKLDLGELERAYAGS